MSKTFFSPCILFCGSTLSPFFSPPPKSPLACLPPLLLSCGWKKKVFPSSALHLRAVRKRGGNAQASGGATLPPSLPPPHPPSSGERRVKNFSSSRVLLAELGWQETQSHAQTDERGIDRQGRQHKNKWNKRVDAMRCDAMQCDAMQSATSKSGIPNRFRFAQHFGEGKKIMPY